MVRFLYLAAAVAMVGCIDRSLAPNTDLGLRVCVTWRPPRSLPGGR